MNWRDKSRPIIGQILHDLEGRPEKEIRKALFDAYPFGMRRYHPYKIWLDEIRRQRFGRSKTPDPRQMAIAEVYGTIQV